MRKLSAVMVLTMLVLMAAAGVADAKGGRTSAADCKAGRSDPDCPDEPDAGSAGKPPASLAALAGSMPYRSPGYCLTA